MYTLPVLRTTLFQHFPRGQRSLSAYINIQYETSAVGESAFVYAVESELQSVPTVR